MILIIAIAAVLIVATILYLRHHAAVAAQADADAAKLKNAAETEAKRIEADVVADVKKIDADVKKAL